MAHEIIRLGHHGDGIASGPIFAARTLPGEIIEGEVINDRISAPRIITPSTDRVAPPCKHYKSCGGCGLQHASDEFVANWKTGVVMAALQTHGLTADVRQIITSAPQSRRRAVFSARRTKKGALVGFHARASDVITETPDCMLLKPELLAIIPALREMAVMGASRKSEIRFTVTASDAGLDVGVSGAKDLDAQLQMSLAALTAKNKISRLTWGGEIIAEAAPPYQLFDTNRVVPPAGAFLQATKEGEQALVDGVVKHAASAKNIVDLFAGCGTFSLPLARIANVHAIEGQADMLAALDQGWRQSNGLKRIITETRDLFRRPLTPDELNQFDTVVIDPPRAGAQKQFEQIAIAKPDRVIAISCNPTSFAKDAKTMVEAGYSIGPIDVIDQFRWSTHVELVTYFTLL